MVDLSPRLDLTPVISEGHHALRAAFLAAGRDIRLVGGAVRDLILGRLPADLDFATDATREEQVHIYRGAGLHFVPTGYEFGTVTVILGGVPQEVTSLRVDKEHDGRHAVTSHTRDWVTDQERRDLTINSVMASLDGTLHDPFDGHGDILAGKVRFVGDPAQRMREDYLRTLRWLRFHARFADGMPLDPAAAAAARAEGEGLRILSGERVWKEMTSMLSLGAPGLRALDAMRDLGLFGPLSIPDGSPGHARIALACRRPDPALLMAAFLSDPARTTREVAMADVSGLAARWRWPSADRDRALFIAANVADVGIDLRRLVAVEKVAVDDAVDLAQLQGRHDEGASLLSWAVPAFPVSGEDLKASGMAQGPLIGLRMRAMRDAWAASGYELGRDDLLSLEDEVAAPAP